MEELLTIEDVARILKYTEYYIRMKCKSGELKAIKIGGHWRIKQEDLRAFVDKQSQPEQNK
jgi:excisionase family DNA binding protein